MRRTRAKALASAIALGAMAVVLAGILAGCTTPQREAEKVAAQAAQLKAFINQADTWGAEIIAQVREEDIRILRPNTGGAREAGDLYREWPKYYYWRQGVILKPDAQHTPEQLADELEPWLEQQGWQRSTSAEPPRGGEFFIRDYFRGPYHLEVEVYTVPLERAQTVNFVIVTPATNPDVDGAKATARSA